jgi:hypothetical protein
MALPSSPDMELFHDTIMKIYSCRKCGGRIIFRPCVWHKKAKRTITPHRARVFPVHLDCPCGQMGQLPIPLAA